MLDFLLCVLVGVGIGFIISGIIDIWRSYCS